MNIEETTYEAIDTVELEASRVLPLEHATRKRAQCLLGISWDIGPLARLSCANVEAEGCCGIVHIAL